MIHRIFITIFFAIATLGLGACASAPKSAATTDAEAVEQICAGPKKRVAILRFGGTGKYGAYEGWDVGEAIAGQLATALNATDCFIIADRMVLSEVLREQELGMAGVLAKESVTRTGRLIGAQVLIKGEITEFETGKKGNGLNLGFGFSKIPLGLRLGGNKKTAHIAIDLRMIDASTGEIIYAETITSEAKPKISAWRSVSITTRAASARIAFPKHPSVKPSATRLSRQPATSCSNCKKCAGPVRSFLPKVRKFL